MKRLIDNPRTMRPAVKALAPVLPGPPRLIVVVDTEETFDWTAPFDRDAVDTSAMAEIGRGQEICDSFGIAPTYVIDYPVACDSEAASTLAAYAREGRATVGAHMHAWVCPPHEETVDPVNSYQGNLPAELEFRKLQCLTDTIRDNCGIDPIVHKSGRYGFGWHTGDHLKTLGYRIDLSPAPAHDMRADGGPDHRDLPASPYWLDDDATLLCLPCTGQFVGRLAGLGWRADSVVRSQIGQRLRLGGIGSRLGLFERIRLSPEGFGLDAMKRVTRALLARGERFFCVSYHSPSLRPGCTPYVRDARDLHDFLSRLRDYFAFFMNEVGGLPATPPDLLQELEAPGRQGGAA